MTRAKLAARLAVALVGVTALLTPGVARADHRLSHWGHGYSPLVSAPCANFGGTFCTYTGGAETTWSNNNYPNDFRTGNPFQGCGSIGGWITSCVGTAAQVHAIEGCERAAVDACTVRQYSFDPNRHLHSAYILVCNACGNAAGGAYFVNELQSLITHEYGHAIGFRHTDVPESVMRETIAAGSGPVHHDRVALGYEYGHTD